MGFRGGNPNQGEVMQSLLDNTEKYETSNTKNVVRGLVIGLLLCAAAWAFSLTPYWHSIAQGLGIEDPQPEIHVVVTH